MITRVYLDDLKAEVYTVEATNVHYLNEYDYLIKKYNFKKKQWNKAQSFKAKNIQDVIQKYQQKNEKDI